MVNRLLNEIKMVFDDWYSLLTKFTASVTNNFTDEFIKFIILRNAKFFISLDHSSYLSIIFYLLLSIIRIF